MSKPTRILWPTPCVMGSFSRLRCFFRFCVFLLLASGATRQAAGEPRRIMLIYPQTGQNSSINLFGGALRGRIMAPIGGNAEFDRLEIIPGWHCDLEQPQAWHKATALRYKEEPPPGTAIVNQPRSYWHEHRRAALASLALLTIAFLLTGVLLQQNRRLLRSKAVLRRQQREMQDNQSELRRLAKAVIAKDDEKSTYLASELHDDISQRVAALAMGLAQLERKLAAGDSAGANEALSSLRGDHDRLAHDLHGLARRLHPAIIGDLGLAHALESFTSNFARDYRMDVRFYCDWGGEDIPSEVALCLYRVVQQGLDNVRRHARTDQARVFLSRDDKGVKLVIEDEGAGFDPAKPVSERGIGLVSMRERVLAQGGTWEIYSAPDAGTSIRAWVPAPEKTAG